MTALRAMYSACTLSRSAVAAANSAPASSWNSASMTIMTAMAPSTMMSATPRSRARLRLRASALGRSVAGRLGASLLGIPKESGCCIGRNTLVVYAYGGPSPTPLSTSVDADLERQRLGCPVTCVVSQVSTHCAGHAGRDTSGRTARCPRRRRSTMPPFSGSMSIGVCSRRTRSILSGTSGSATTK